MDGDAIMMIGLVLAGLWFLMGPGDASAPAAAGLPSPVAVFNGGSNSPAPTQAPSVIAGGRDQIDLASVQIVNSPDVGSWPATVSITHVSAAPDNVRFTIAGVDNWPDVVPPGWDGPLLYTVWLFLWNGEQWAAAAFVQMWRGRDGVGDGIQDFATNWYYASRWSPLYGHGEIAPGETIGFMVSAGNARDGGQITTMERSNIVTLQVPGGYAGEFDFSG